MRLLFASSVFMLAASASAAIAAPTVQFDAGSGTLPAGTTVIENFDDVASGTAIGNNAYALNTSSGIGAIPAFGSSGNYGSVLGGGTYSISFAPASTFAFVLGSLDSYNTLKLSFADNTSITYSGTQIIGSTPPPYADGNQSAGYTNGVVSFLTGAGPKIVGAQFSSSGNSFEFDNISVTPAPEPAAWMMMIAGFGVIGTALRRRQSFAARTA